MIQRKEDNNPEIHTLNKLTKFPQQPKLPYQGPGEKGRSFKFVESTAGSEQFKPLGGGIPEGRCHG